MLFEVILYIIILATALPVAWFLSWLCKDELVSDRKWFMRALWIFIVALIVLLLFYRNMPSLLSLAYMTIIIIIMLIFGKNKRFIN